MKKKNKKTKIKSVNKKSNVKKVKHKEHLGKRILRYFLIFICICFLAGLIGVGAFFTYIVTTTEDFDANKLYRAEATILYDKDGKDVSENYSFTTSGGILEIIQREVKLAVKAGQGKKYGNKDSELEFIVYYNGIAEEMAEDDYKGALDREDGEIPGYYKINWGTFELELNGVIDNERVANYLVLEK